MLSVTLFACSGEDAPPSDPGAGGSEGSSAGQSGAAGTTAKGGSAGSSAGGSGAGADSGGSASGGAGNGGGAGAGGSGGGAGTSASGASGGGSAGSGGSSGTTNATGGSSGAGGSSGSGDGTLLGGMCRPNCVDASTDPDADGWGWENEQSCVVVGSAPYNQGTRCDTSGGAGGSDASGGSSGSGGGSGAGGSSGDAGASGSAGAGGSGGSGTDCGVAPVNPNASPQAKKLLCYLYDIYGKNVLSGQQETSWSNPENDISWYGTNVGKYPAILGGDYLYPNGTTSRARAYWEAGGITMIRYHMGAPPSSDTYENSQGTADIGAVLTQGTTQNQSFVSKLDYIAAELQQLEDANVAVLWAPFHEYQPNGWFWWSKGSAQQFIELWRYMYRYLTETKGLDNLVWLAPSSGTLNAQWYPGKEYLDVAGPDTYTTDPPFASIFQAARGVIGPTVPITLHETGVVPQPDTMFPDTAPWVLFSVWAGYQISNNGVDTMQSAYASSYTLTRDEVPNLK